MDSDAYKKPVFRDLTNLSPEKFQVLEIVLNSILSLPLARETYAQIIDGKPIRTPWSDEIKAGTCYLFETIIVSNDTKPSNHAMQQYDSMRTSLSIAQDLRIDLKVHTLLRATQLHRS